MRRAPALAALALYLGLVGYLAWAYPRLPATVPMQFDAHDRPTSHGSREAFVAIPAIVPLLPSIVLLFASHRTPALAWAAPVLLAIVLLVMHAALGAILPGLPLRIGVTTAVLISFGTAAAGFIALAVAHRRGKLAPTR
jgi:hypothetical protein